MKILRSASAIFTIVILLTGCGQAATPTPTAAPTGTATPVPPTATPVPTETPAPTATAVRTPPALPAIYTSGLLNKLDTPHTYISDTCKYLKLRWDPNNAVPGTVVMPIMYHSVTDDDKEITDATTVHHSYLIDTMQHAHDLGFETITTEQLADFLENNASIPKRSMIMIVDDRRTAENYKTHFLDKLKEYNWTVTNAWISTPLSQADLLTPLAKLVAKGWIDIQSHGVVHNVNITNASSDEYIHSEMDGSITYIQEHFGVTPIAYIWPGGSFSQRAVEIGREDGYKLGFTINPRGPIMFNWVPLADNKDPGRPSYLPEGGVSDLLMVLPRYWSTNALEKLDEVAAIGDEAAAQAQANKATELEYYDIMCSSTYGAIPTPEPGQ
jgi:peptidoglycan/xylan/chitin deacetylase (PgdA/CDA1 family)